MLEITLVLEWVFLDDVKSYDTNKDFYYTRIHENISVNYNKSIDVGKP